MPPYVYAQLCLFLDHSTSTIAQVQVGPLPPNHLGFRQSQYVRRLVEHHEAPAAAAGLEEHVRVPVRFWFFSDLAVGDEVSEFAVRPIGLVEGPRYWRRAMRRGAEVPIALVVLCD